MATFDLGISEKQSHVPIVRNSVLRMLLACSKCTVENLQDSVKQMQVFIWNLNIHVFHTNQTRLGLLADLNLG